MSFTQTYKTVTSSKIFKDFIKENKDAELVAGFFIVDFFSNDTKQSIDYKLGEKIFTFELRKETEVIMTEDKLIGDSTIPLLKISPEIRFDLERVSQVAQEQAKDRSISAKFNKIIAVLQNTENRQAWNLTCMLDGLIILHIFVDSETGEVIKFDRKSIADFIVKK